MTNMSIFLVFLLCDFSLNFDVKSIDLTIVSHFVLLLSVYIFLMFFVWATITYSIVTWILHSLTYYESQY